VTRGRLGSFLDGRDMRLCIKSVRVCRRAPYRLLCEPSHNAGFWVRLQPHSHAVPSVSAVKGFGANSLPLCDPSQNGCLADMPQLHHQYVFPAATSTAYGDVCATTGSDILCPRSRCGRFGATAARKESFACRALGWGIFDTLHNARRLASAIAQII
jgi:hypothetical protein